MQNFSKYFFRYIIRVLIILRRNIFQYSTCSKMIVLFLYQSFWPSYSKPLAFWLKLKILKFLSSVIILYSASGSSIAFVKFQDCRMKMWPMSDLLKNVPTKNCKISTMTYLPGNQGIFWSLTSRGWLHGIIVDVLRELIIVGIVVFPGTNMGMRFWNSPSLNKRANNQ